MAQEGNKYADKIFSEHPIALWPLDEKAFYLSQIDDTERNFTNWTTGGTDRVNFCTNPSFETNTSGWAAYGAGTAIARVTTDKYVGTASVEVTKAAVLNSGIQTGVMPVAPSLNYTISAYVKVPAGNETSTLRINMQFYDGTPSALTSSTPTTYTISNSDGWVRFTNSGAAPAGAKYVVIFLVSTATPTAGQKFLVDAVMIEQATSAGSYFDGSNGGAWLDSLNNSASAMMFKTRVNLIQNPSAETNINGWASTAGSAARSTAQFINGSASAAITWNGTSGIAYNNPVGGGRYPVVGGKTYTFSAYLRDANAARNMQQAVEWYDSGLVYVGGAGGLSTSITTTGWTRVTLTATAPANATYATPTWNPLAIPTNGHITYIDSALMEESLAAYPYFDGSFAAIGYGGTAHTAEAGTIGWNGTAHASSSFSKQWNTISTTLPDAASPFDDDFYSSFKRSIPVGGTMELVSPDLFGPTDVSAEIPNFTVNLFMYMRHTYVNWIRYGIRYNDALSVPQEVISAEIPAPIAPMWTNINQTYDLPASWSGPVKFFIQINMDDSTGDAAAREFIMNGFSVGQGSEPTAYESLGVNPVALPAELNLAAFLGVPADQYGLSSEVGYYLVRNNNLLARNDGLPIIYGTDHSTKIYNTVYGFPSLVFPGKGMLHEEGRNKYYTLEAWMKIDPLTTTAHKVIGPLDSNDGIYVKEGFLTLVIGDEIGSYCVSEWYRPMLMHLVLKEANATVMVNGEEVISIPFNRGSVSLPDLRDWWGVFSYDEVGAFTIDTISIFPYIVSNAVAKRRFVYGLGTPNPQSIDAAFYGTSTEIEFSTAEYNNSVIYPDMARWDAGYFNNLIATKDYLSVPNYSLPYISLGGRDLQEWYDNNYTINTSEYPDGNHPKFVSLRPNQVTRTNLCPNPSFETDTSNWLGANSAISTSTTWFSQGSKSVRVAPNTVSNDSYAYYAGDQSIFVAGRTYTISGTVHTPSTQTGSLGWLIRAIWVGPYVGAVLTGAVVSASGPATGSARVSATFTIPSGMTNISIRLGNGGDNSSSNFVYWDNILIEEAPSALPYFDGSYADPAANAISYNWTGTAHASKSTLSYWNPNGINYQDPAYLNFPTLNVLNDQVTAVYGVFETESNIASDRPLISFVNVVNGERFDIVCNADEITYRLNSTDLYSEIIPIGTEFVVGVNFNEAGLNFGYDVSRFFSSPSSVQVFVGGDGTTTYEGKIYTIGFANSSNYKYISTYFYGEGQVGRGLINPDFYDIMLDHIASYTLVPEYEYGHLFLDIAVAAEWEEYFPLSYFASYVIDENGDRSYDLDMLQLNMSYTSIISTDIWNYYELQQAYATYALLNTGTGPFSNYFNLQKNNTTGDTIDVSNSAIQTYITFQPIASGANSPLSEFTYGKALSGTLVIDADAENTGAEPYRAYDTIYAFRDNTVVFPPKVRPFEDYAMVVHLIIKQRSTLKNPLKIKRFEIASKNFNYNAIDGSNTNKTPVGTKFGKKIFPQSNVYGGVIDHKWKSPYMIYKASTPYLYTTKYSGVKVANETYMATPQPTQNEVFIPINESGAFQYKVAALQFMVRPDFLNETAETKIMEVRHRDGTLTFTATKQGDFANINVYKRAEAVYVDGGSPSTPSYLGNFNGDAPDTYYTQYMDITTGTSTLIGLVADEYTTVAGTEFYQNGRYVENPLLKLGEWTAIGMSLPYELSFDEYEEGGIALFGGFVFNNISYYQSDGLGIESTVISRTWQGAIDDQVPAQPAPPNIWSRWSGDDWEYIYVLGTDIDFSSTPEDIFNAYMGTNSLIIDDGNRVDMRQKEVKLITAATWSNFADKPA